MGVVRKHCRLLRLHVLSGSGNDAQVSSNFPPEPKLTFCLDHLYFTAWGTTQNGSPKLSRQTHFQTPGPPRPGKAEGGQLHQCDCSTQ